jgi:hypothetical protein
MLLPLLALLLLLLVEDDDAVAVADADDDDDDADADEDDDEVEEEEIAIDEEDDADEDDDNAGAADPPIAHSTALRTTSFRIAAKCKCCWCGAAGVPMTEIQSSMGVHKIRWVRIVFCAYIRLEK